MCEFCYNTTTQYLTVDKEFTCGDSLKVVEMHDCMICEKLFLGKSMLLVHQSIIHGRNHRHVHIGERLIKCELCDKVFTHVATVTIHRQLHTGQRPYWCEWCEHEFIFQALLTVHKKSCSVKKSEYSVWWVAGLNIQYDGLQGESVVCSVKWGMLLTTFLCVLFDVSNLLSSTFVQ
jgi:hypothetical protein